MDALDACQAERGVNECERLPASSSLLTQLPPEILHTIAFLSFNPNLYLVCRALRLRLYHPAEFLKDTALLLMCTRRNCKSVWASLSCLPWCTGPGRQWNLTLAQNEQETLQRLVFNLEYVTTQRLTMMVRFLLRLWVEMEALNHTRRLKQERNMTAADYDEHDDEGAILLNASESLPPERQSSVPDLNVGGRAKGPKFIVQILYVPTRLLGHRKGVDGEELGKLLLNHTSMDSLNHSIVKKYIATAKPKWMHT